MTPRRMRQAGQLLRMAVAVPVLSLNLLAQGGRAGAPTSKAMAPVDLTGQWVAIINEDWRFRMITPAKSDVAGVPLNPAGRKLADSWDPAKDEAAGEQCKSYGAPGLLRHPLRLRISWADDETLKLETDAGMQTRMFYFKEPKSQGGEWQGVSKASWETLTSGLGRGRAASPTSGGALTVITTQMRAGYLRKNGVPYSDKAMLTEYFDRTNEPNGDSWLIVTSVVEDPTYLAQPFVVSTHFKKQADQAGWRPAPCSAR